MRAPLSCDAVSGLFHFPRVGIFFLTLDHPDPRSRLGLLFLRKLICVLNVRCTELHGRKSELLHRRVNTLQEAGGGEK